MWSHLTSVDWIPSYICLEREELEYLWRLLMNSTLMDDRQAPSPQKNRDLDLKSYILGNIISSYLGTCWWVACDLMLSFCLFISFDSLPLWDIFRSKSLSFLESLWPLLSQHFQFFLNSSILPDFTLISVGVLPFNIWGKWRISVRAILMECRQQT